MAPNRKHPENCENATKETCKCGHCAGTQHGWVGTLQLIRDGTPKDLRDFEQDVDRRWEEQCDNQDSKNQERPKATLPHKKAAVDSARFDLINWLRSRLHRRGRPKNSGSTVRFDSPSAAAGTSHQPEEPRKASHRHPEETRSDPPGRSDPELDPAVTDRALAEATSEAEQVQALGNMLGQVLNAVEKDLGPLPPETRRAMADHFWCELLVALVVVIAESNRVLDSVPERVAAKITESRSASGLTKIQARIVAACAKQAWKRITGALGLTLISDAKALLPALRTLAVLMCKYPPRHPAVVEHCVDPLKALLIQRTKERLQRVFGDLVPQIKSEITGAVQPT